MSRRAYAKLTAKEEQRVVALRAEGLTFDVIAARIGCSKGTIWNVLRAHGPSSTPKRIEDEEGAIVSEQPAPRVHILSQEGQPYGSERRCCNHCGVMIWGASAPLYVDNWIDWRENPNRCENR